MAYGTPDKELAEKKCAELAVQHPENQYEVQPYEYKQVRFGGPSSKEVVKWGIGHWVPYCERWPFRFAGFLWIFQTIGIRTYI